MARIKLTAGRMREFECPIGTAQAFLWDTEAPGLAVRATPGSGTRAFVFQSKLNGKALRMTIGDVRAWGIDAARAEARRLQTLIDQGTDPRQEKAARIAAAEETKAVAHAAKQEAARQKQPALLAWHAYVEARKPKWGELSIRDHERLSQEGGVKIKRGRKTGEDGKTQPGALRSLLQRPLVEIDAERVQSWLKTEAAKRPTRAALAFRLLRGFLNWCAEHPDYAGQVQANACATKKVREELPKRAAKRDALQREMLRPWFEQVRKLPNAVQSAYLQTALLTGARREELLDMRWEDVDFRWKHIIIHDKIEGERIIPLTPYVAALLRDLKTRNDIPPPEYRILHGKRIKNDLENWKPSPWVFSSKTAASGRLQEPRIAHLRALTAAGLPNVTIHGLRRSFKSLAEWVEVPAGIVAQIMGHKPSATAEKHYTVRPLDLLRMWHSKIEGWILEQAGIEQPAAEQDEKTLRVVG